MTQRHIILGFGIVEICTDTPAAVVKRSRTMGVHLAYEPMAKFALGYADSNMLIVPEQADDVRLEATASDGLFTVKVESAKLDHPDAGK